MDRAWEAGGRGGITSLETPLTQRARSSPGGGAQARGAGKAVHAPHKLRAARPPAHVPPSPTQNRALAPRPGGGSFWAPDFAIPPAFGPRSARENTRSAGRAARIGSPESDCAPHRREEPTGPSRRGLWVAPGLGPVVARGLGPELASTAAMWSLTFVECLLPAPPFTTFSPWGEPQRAALHTRRE